MHKQTLIRLINVLLALLTTPCMTGVTSSTSLYTSGVAGAWWLRAGQVDLNGQSALRFQCVQSQFVFAWIVGFLICHAGIATAQPAPSKSDLSGWGTVVDPAGDCQFEVMDRSLTITVPGSSHDLNPLPEFGNLNAPRVMRELGDAFTVQVQVAPLQIPKPKTSSSQGKTKHSYVGAGLLLWKDEKNFARYERAANGDTNVIFLKLEVFADGELVFSRNVRLGNKAVHLRIARSARRFEFSHSEGGDKWLPHANVQLPLPGKLSTGVMAINATTREVVADFRDLSVEQTSVALAPAEVVPQEIQYGFLPTGITAKLGGYTPNQAEMSDKSDIVTKLPDGVTEAKYGTLKLDNREWAFALVEPKGKPASLYVDTNADGDLTNDPPTKWQAADKTYNGEGKVELASEQIGTVRAYRFDPNDPLRARMKNVLFYYADFGTEVKFQLDGKPFSTFIKGDLSNSPTLSIDRDGNGKISTNFERVSLWTPFNYTGTSYVFSLKNGRLGLETSETSIPQVPLPPDMSVGKPALKFSATKLDDATVNFPGEYAGKIVMLDFWATWCGPCIAEIPNMKAAYAAWHDAGYEILGVSLDDEGELEKVQSFLTKQELPWSQIYEGRGWRSSLSELHDVSGIPFVLLVDGDSGMIIETERGLRGPGLSKVIGEHLMRKQLTATVGSPEYWSAAESFWSDATQRKPVLAQASAQFFAGAKRFQQAIPFARQVCESSSGNSHPWLFAATLAALANDNAAYEGICREMAKRFEATPDARAATHVCKAVLLRPGMVELAAQFEKPFVDELESGKTDPALQTFRWGLRGLLAYRSNDASKALEHLQKGEAINGPQIAKAQNLLIQAMAQHKLGNHDQSKESFSTAKKLIDIMERSPSLKADGDLLMTRLLAAEYRQLTGDKENVTGEKENSASPK